MKRREFLMLVVTAGAAVALPRIVAAQQDPPTIAYYALDAATPSSVRGMDIFGAGLAHVGLIAGRDYVLRIFSADSHSERLPDLIQSVLASRPAVIFANTPVTIQAAHEATATVPIVFQTGVDPVAARIVQSLSHPGSNITGFHLFGRDLDVKRIEVLHDVVPTMRTVGLIWNPQGIQPDFAAMAAAADKLAMSVATAEISAASTDGDIDAVFAGFRAAHVDGVVIASDPTLANTPSIHDRIMSKVAEDKLPSIGENWQFALGEGGLIGYGFDTTENWFVSGELAGRILRGEKPADLPVQETTKFEVTINLKTAKAIGINIPPSLLLQATKVIE